MRHGQSTVSMPWRTWSTWEPNHCFVCAAGNHVGGAVEKPSPNLPSLAGAGCVIVARWCNTMHGNTTARECTHTRTRSSGLLPREDACWSMPRCCQRCDLCYCGLLRARRETNSVLQANRRSVLPSSGPEQFSGYTLPAGKQIFKWLFCGTQHKQDEHQQHQTQRREKIGVSCGPPPKGTNTTMEIRA